MRWTARVSGQPAAEPVDPPLPRSAQDDSPVGDADQALVALYLAHYRSLVRIAALLLHDVPAAEDVVQDAFVAMHGAWRRLRDPDKAVPYLRQAVVNRARSRLRHLEVVERKTPPPPPAGAGGQMPSAEYGAMQALAGREVMAALRALPQRQREVLVLRYYADLSEAQIADTLGISQGAVKSHASRGVAALRETLERAE
ncbi:MAG TPA: SigE family RNA polymerase sigma factor [Mycobacteriales bacterium]|nr:SigE family RNA polymerase sigma factor [Mycobacteriales bacterium]